MSNCKSVRWSVVPIGPKVSECRKEVVRREAVLKVPTIHASTHGETSVWSLAKIRDSRLEVGPSNWGCGFGLCSKVLALRLGFGTWCLNLGFIVEVWTKTLKVLAWLLELRSRGRRRRKRKFALKGKHWPLQGRCQKRSWLQIRVKFLRLSALMVLIRYKWMELTKLSKLGIHQMFRPVSLVWKLW